MTEDSGGGSGGNATSAVDKSSSASIKARVVVMTASGATASQYMNYMNAFFTAQKMGVPVDTCMMDRESGLLQQGADITGGIYVKVPNLDSLFQVSQPTTTPTKVLRTSLLTKW